MPAGRRSSTRSITWNRFSNAASKPTRAAGRGRGDDGAGARRRQAAGGPRTMVTVLFDAEQAITTDEFDQSSFASGEAERLAQHFADLIDQQTGAIGRVVGSEKEPAGAHQFCIWAADGARSLDVGHVVVAFSEEAAVIGVVDEPRRFSDLRTFLDDYFDRHVEAALEAELATRRPEILVFTVNVLATKHLRADVTSHRPPVSGPVYFATPAAIDYALGRDD